MQFLTKCDFTGLFSADIFFRRGNTVVSLAGQIKDSVKIWQTLTRDQEVLEIVKDWGSVMMSKEVKELSSKGAIASVKQEESQFLSTIILLRKKYEN